MSDSKFSDNFYYTQASLAAFDKCPLKFKKRYLENIKWNSIPDLKITKRLEMGRDFHLLAQRYFMGIDSEDYERTELDKWINNLKQYFKLNKGLRYLPEYKLRLDNGFFKLEANFDLLIVKEDKIEIWDWKTHESTRENRRIEGKNHVESMQTVVYLFVLKELSNLVANMDLGCENIKMFYWQPNPPIVIEEVQYSNEIHEKYGKMIKDKINKIKQYDYSTFDKKIYRKVCSSCEFNWYCNNERIDFQAIYDAEEN